MNKDKKRALSTLGIILLTVLLGVTSYMSGHKTAKAEASTEYWEASPPIGYKWTNCANVSSENRADNGQVLLVPECLIAGDTVHYQCQSGKAHSFMLINQ